MIISCNLLQMIAGRGSSEMGKQILCAASYIMKGVQVWDGDTNAARYSKPQSP